MLIAGHGIIVSIVVSIIKYEIGGRLPTVCSQRHNPRGSHPSDKPVAGLHQYREMQLKKGSSITALCPDLPPSSARNQNTGARRTSNCSAVRGRLWRPSQTKLYAQTAKAAKT